MAWLISRLGFIRKQTVRNNIVSRVMIFCGLLGMVLSVCFIISLVMVSLLMFFLYFFCEPDFNVLFLWIGMPLTLLLSIWWAGKNLDYIKRATDGR